MYRPHFDPAELSGAPRAQVRRVIGLLRPHVRLIAAALVCVLVGAGLGLIPAYLLKSVIDDALPHRDGHRLDILVVLMVAAPLAAGLVSVLQSYLTTLVGQRVMYELRNLLYTRLLAMPLRWYTGVRTGEVMSRLTSDVSGVQTAVSDTFVSLVSNLVTVGSTLVVMAFLSWELTLISIGILPLFILPTRRVGLATFAVRKRAQEQQASLAAHMQETLQVSGAMLVKTFQTQARETGRFEAGNRSLMRLQVRGAMIGRWFFMMVGFVSAAGPALLYWAGGHAVISGSLSLGVVVAFGAYLGRLYSPVSSLASVHVNVQGSLALFARLFEYIELEPEIRAPERPIPVPDRGGRIDLRAVSFAYPTPPAAAGNGTTTDAGASLLPAPVIGNGVEGEGARDADVAAEPRWALRGVDLEVRPGQLVALVGPSGAGKSTLTYLLPRLYDVTDGAVLIDSVDVRDADPQDIGRRIGMVTQETFLFHASIADNLRYARPDASDDELRAACRAANIDGLIDDLPAGLDTIVGERGHRLSGGERQRLAIARVLLKDPRILILDEATSSLDSASERLVQEALERLMRGRTTVVIAHRLSTVRRADLIVVLASGRIVERGSHDELLAANGLYASLHAIQFREPKAPAGALSTKAHEESSR